MCTRISALSVKRVQLASCTTRSCLVPARLRVQSPTGTAHPTHTDEKPGAGTPQRPYPDKEGGSPWHKGPLWIPPADAPVPQWPMRAPR